ncbi:MAG: CPBP family intramembrane metalloprotease [Verrucomicrobia bacterium]|nr:CPBP family intramembrane metalloprotease [Verrucomicrobiota bacterium]
MACPRQTRRASVHRVRTARAFILYIAVVFLGAALIAPWIHSAGQAIAEAFPASANTFNQPFHRYVNRSLLVLAIIGIWPLSKFLNVQGRAHLGFPSRASWHRELATGFLAGFVSLAAAAGMAMAAGARILHPDLTLERFLSAAASAIATAAIVALVEELLFRGVIFGQLLRATSCLTALIFSSAVYAIVHFFQRPPSPSEITPWTGIWTLGQMLGLFTPRFPQPVRGRVGSCRAVSSHGGGVCLDRTPCRVDLLAEAMDRRHRGRPPSLCLGMGLIASGGWMDHVAAASRLCRLGAAPGISIMIVLPPVVRSFREAVLGWVYPEVCFLCGIGDANREHGYVCQDCQAGIRRILPPFCNRCGLPFAGESSVGFECSNCDGIELAFHHARSALHASGVGLDLVHHYKYHGALWFDPLLKRLMSESESLDAFRSGFHAIVPVPLHPTKQAEREYNQAERLGRLLASVLDLPLVTEWIGRRTPTSTQTRLTRRQRSANVRRAFELRAAIPGSVRKVILVDDVLTTGATTDACARVLKQGGVEEVWVWTLARGV